MPLIIKWIYICKDITCGLLLELWCFLQFRYLLHKHIPTPKHQTLYFQSQTPCKCSSDWDAHTSTNTRLSHLPTFSSSISHFLSPALASRSSPPPTCRLGDAAQHHPRMEKSSCVTQIAKDETPVRVTMALTCVRVVGHVQNWTFIRPPCFKL